MGLYKKNNHSLLFFSSHPFSSTIELPSFFLTVFKKATGNKLINILVHDLAHIFYTETLWAKIRPPAVRTL